MMWKILSILIIPVMLLNVGGGIVGGIWLAFRGEWRLIITGIVLAAISPWILSILMLPSLGIGMVAMMFKERKWVLYVLGFFSQVYTNVLIMGTCLLAFFICARHKSGEVDFSAIPYLLWSWGMALGPWQYFASKEPDNEFSGITLLCATLLYFVFLISLFTPPVLQVLVLVFIILVQLIILPSVNMYLARLSEKNQTIV